MTELAVYFYVETRGWAHFLNPFDPSPDAVASVAVGSRFFFRTWPVVTAYDYMSRSSLPVEHMTRMGHGVDGVAMFSMRMAKNYVTTHFNQLCMYIHILIHIHTYDISMYCISWVHRQRLYLEWSLRCLFLRDSKQCVVRILNGKVERTEKHQWLQASRTRATLLVKAWCSVKVVSGRRGIR